MKIKIEKGYAFTLVIVLLFVIGENIISLLVATKPSAYFHITLGLLILLGLLLKSKYLKTLIKIWAAISVVGGLLVVISHFMFWLGGAPEKISYDSLLVSIIHIVVGGLFYYFSDKSIKIVKESHDA